MPLNNPSRGFAEAKPRLPAAFPQLDLTKLRTFYEVARLGSVYRAAEVLHCSQPAISHRLRALQDDLGTVVLERVGRNLRLTREGEELLTHCLDLMALARRISDGMQSSTSGYEGKVTLGTYAAVSSQLLVPVIDTLIRQYPKISLGLSLGNTEPLCDDLRAGKVDLLLLVGVQRTSGLHLTPVGRDQLVAAMSPKLAAAHARHKDTIDPAALSKLRYLCWGGPRDETFEAAQRYAHRHHLITDTTPYVPHTETLRALAQCGAGYTILPSYTVRADVKARRLVALRLKGMRYVINFSLIRRKHQILTRPMTLLSEMIRNLSIEIEPNA